MSLSYQKFLKTLPETILPHLPPSLQGIQIRQPWRWLLQLHYGEPWLHYEVSRPRGRKEFELAFHCESKDRDLNRHMLYGFRRHLFEIKDTLGQTMEAEMWDRGWTKIYEIYPEGELTAEYQVEIGARMADIIICLHPIYVDLRGQVAQVYR